MEEESYLQTSKLKDKKILETLQRFKHRTKKDFKKRWKSVRAGEPLQLVMLDTMDMGAPRARLNGGYQHLSIVIDVFSRFIWVEPMKKKSELYGSVKKIFNKIYNKYNKYPTALQADNEYKNNNKLQELYRQYNIDTKFVEPNRSDKRGTALVERVIGTLRRMIGIWTTLYNNPRFIDSLQRIVESYNYEYEHKTIGTEPAYAIDNNITFIKQRPDWNNKHEKKVYMYKVGDRVRIINEKKLKLKKLHMAKKNIEHYFKEVWTITQVYGTTLVDLKRGDVELKDVRQNDIELVVDESSPPPSSQRVRRPVDEVIRDAEREVRVERAVNRTGIQNRPFGVRRSNQNDDSAVVINEDGLRRSRRIQNREPTPPPVYRRRARRRRTAFVPHKEEEDKEPTPPPVYRRRARRRRR